MKEKKLLQVVNLSPSEDWVERIVEIHPMKQIFWASIIQACVFGFMLFSFWGISIGLQASNFDFEQMEEDGKRLEAAEFRMDFNIENPKHKYFIAINILDVASTLYAIENRNTLKESNYLLPAKPELEELLLQKAIVTYTLNYLGLFSNHPEDRIYINVMNIALTGAVIHNLHQINKHD